MYEAFDRAVLRNKKFPPKTAQFYLKNCAITKWFLPIVKVWCSYLVKHLGLARASSPSPKWSPAATHISQSRTPRWRKLLSVTLAAPRHPSMLPSPTTHPSRPSQRFAQPRTRSPLNWTRSPRPGMEEEEEIRGEEESKQERKLTAREDEISSLLLAC